ncbi:hypothetical protein P3L10_033100 [Capsicum annuum]|uniref:uncharacterized protein LOC124891373 n=1 Tax=Capsicum annuum TaxID=4072 RepID=UPI001FB05C35|nr:uncharacterized protein LOC124891373 [Capsicum annuum]
MEGLDISISPDLSDLLDEEDEELEKVHREQDKEWMTLCQLAGAHKPCNERYLPFFKDCIGALDDTHVKARLPQGSAHDSRIFREALRRQEFNFPHPLKNKYYLFDSGYSHTKEYMAPYRGDNVRKKCNVDNAFQTTDNERYISSVDFDVGTTSTANKIDGKHVNEESNVHWVGLRDVIANDICNA